MSALEAIQLKREEKFVFTIDDEDEIPEENQHTQGHNNERKYEQKSPANRIHGHN